MKHVGIKRDDVEKALAPNRKVRVADKFADRLSRSAFEIAYVVAEWFWKGSGRDYCAVKMVGHYLEFLKFDARLLAVEAKPFFANYLADLSKMGFIL